MLKVIHIVAFCIFCISTYNCNCSAVVEQEPCAVDSSECSENINIPESEKEAIKKQALTCQQDFAKYYSHQKGSSIIGIGTINSPQHLVTISDDGQMILWNQQTRYVEHTLFVAKKTRVKSSFHQKSPVFAVTTSPTEISIYHVKDKKISLLYKLSFTQDISLFSLGLSTSHVFIAAATQDRKLHVIQLMYAKNSISVISKSETSIEQSVAQISFSYNGDYIVGIDAAKAKEMYLWKLDGANQIISLGKDSWASPVLHLAMHPHLNIALVTLHSSIQLYSLEDKKISYTLQKVGKSSFFSPSGAFIFISGDELSVFQVDSESPFSLSQTSMALEFKSSPASLGQISFSSDGRELYIGGSAKISRLLIRSKISIEPFSSEGSIARFCGSAWWVIVHYNSISFFSSQTGHPVYQFSISPDIKERIEAIHCSYLNKSIVLLTRNQISLWKIEVDENNQPTQLTAGAKTSIEHILRPLREHQSTLKVLSEGSNMLTVAFGFEGDGFLYIWKPFLNDGKKIDNIPFEHALRTFEIHAKEHTLANISPQVP